jgi:hypothetical protein
LMQLVRMVMSHPIAMRDAVGADGEVLRHDDGKVVKETVPDHPIRPAREWELNSFWVEVEGTA